MPDAVDGEFGVAGDGMVEGGFEVVDDALPHILARGAILTGAAHVEDNYGRAGINGEIDRAFEVQGLVGVQRVGEAGVGDDRFDGKAEAVGGSAGEGAQLGGY